MVTMATTVQLSVPKVVRDVLPRITVVRLLTVWNASQVCMGHLVCLTAVIVPRGSVPVTTA